MLTLARRIFWIALLSGAGYAVYTAWQRRSEPMPDGPAEWPPFDDTPADDISTAAAAVAPLPDLGDTPETAPLPDVSHIAESTTPNVVATPWVEPTRRPVSDRSSDQGQLELGHLPRAGWPVLRPHGARTLLRDRRRPVADGYRRAKA
ncbi:MAG: hypothetical protein R2697_21395 [Ilumatobacteraceae bacterium]